MNVFSVTMFDQLKPIMRNGERYIIVEGGRPEYVLLHFQDYVLLTAGMRSADHRRNNPERERGNVDMVNAELEAVRARADGFPVEVPLQTLPGNPGDPSTIRLEDLPL